MSTKKEKVMYQIKVGPARYTVKKVEGLHFDGNVFGLCSSLDKEILIRSGMQPEQEMQTVLHEVLHAVINEYCIRNAASMDAEEEEVIVDLIGLGVTQALCSSPEFRKYLLKQSALKEDAL